MKKVILAGEVSDALYDALRQRIPEVVRFEGDLANEEEVTSALSDADALIYAPIVPTEAELGNRIGTLLRGGYNLLKAAAENATTRRILLLSTLDLFSRLPQNWKVHPGWRPRPSTSPAELLSYLAECSTREIVRVSGRFNPTAGLHQLVVRFGDDQDIAARADFITKALAHPLPENRSCSFRIGHIGRATHRPPATTASAATVLAPTHAIPSRPVRRVALFGAAGPVLAAAALELAPDYALMLSDIHSLRAFREANNPQSPNAPLPTPPEELPQNKLGLPHTEHTLDVGDLNAVLAASAECDAIINGTVLRHEPVGAFHVNAQGAYNLCRAAVQHDIRRLVQTGPLQTAGHSEDDYSWDWAIDQPPARPGTGIYAHSKYLGQEIVRVFAENYGLSVPNLLYTQFLSLKDRKAWCAAMVVTWEDSARALRAALEVPPEQLGSPYEEFHISETIPQDAYRYDRARRILGWEAQDDISFLWQE